MRSKEITLFSSAARTASVAGTGFDVNLYTEGIAMLRVSAQGSYTDETLDVAIQTYDQVSGEWIDHTSFTQVTNGAVSNPVEEFKKLTQFGSHLRANAVLAGTAENYTFSVGLVVKE